MLPSIICLQASYHDAGHQQCHGDCNEDASSSASFCKSLWWREPEASRFDFSGIWIYHRASPLLLKANVDI